MNYKKTFLFSLIFSFAFINSNALIKAGSSSCTNPTGWFSNFSLPDTKSIDVKGLCDTSAKYLGYITAGILLEQALEKWIYRYNDYYATHAQHFRKAILHSALNNNQELSCDNEAKLKTMASEFRNPLYRYTLGWFIKNRIEVWLNQQIETKRHNRNYRINEADLNQRLIIGSI